MDRRTAIEAMLGKLKAGQDYDRESDYARCEAAFPDNLWEESSSALLAIRIWTKGCLTSAKKLHMNELPGAKYIIESVEDGYCSAGVYMPHGWAVGKAKDDAKAWFIAILSAKLRAMIGTEDTTAGKA